MASRAVSVSWCGKIDDGEIGVVRSAMARGQGERARTERARDVDGERKQ